MRAVLSRAAGSRAASPRRAGTPEATAPAAVEEEREETVDLYLMPPGEDAETCRDWIRMRLRDGRYSLLFEEYISDGDVLISPSMSFEVPVRTLSGLMALGYSLGAIIRRDSVVMRSEGLTAKYDTIVQLGQRFFQIEGRDRGAVERAAAALGLAGTFIPRSYIELVQLGRLVSECAPRLEDCGFLPPAVAASMAAPPHLQPPTPPPPPLLARASTGLAPTSPGGTRLHTRQPASATPMAAARMSAPPPTSAAAAEEAADQPLPPAQPAATARRAVRMDAAAVAEGLSPSGSEVSTESQDAPRLQLPLLQQRWESRCAFVGVCLHLPLHLTRATTLARSNGVAWLAEAGGSFSSAASGTERRVAAAPPRPPSQPPRVPSSLSAPASAPGASLEEKLVWLEARVHAMAWNVPPMPLPPLWRHGSDEVCACSCCD